ncbi:hypothetical protein [Slackia heliotrinireducens]|uniref:hypothetical protein n=1 Tax=Slackia heliotrinireducens TaxID=84110 RepID=UPI003315D7FF
MIINSYNDIPYFSCKAAEIRPENKTDHFGTFVAAGESFTIKIVNAHSDDERFPRVWARVELIDKVAKDRVDDYACKVAAKAIADPAFAPVKVDLRDGETAYMKTWTCRYPDDEAMDAFIMQAKDFIEAHIGELRALSAPAKTPPDDLPFLEDLLSLI